MKETAGELDNLVKMSNSFVKGKIVFDSIRPQYQANSNTRALRLRQDLHRSFLNAGEML